MIKVKDYIPEILIVIGVAVIVGVVTYLNLIAGLFCLGVLLIGAGLIAAKARG